MNIREKLTVVVTIRNRRNTLPRVMNYYKDFPANVIFLDSTSESEGAYEKEYLATPNTYWYTPEKQYSRKLYDCFKQITTKYSVLVCDDDFLVKSCLEKCLQFLEENDDYVGCRGQEVALHDNFLSYETLDYLIESLDRPGSSSPRERVYRAWTYFNGANVHNILRTSSQLKIQEFHLNNFQFNAISIYDKTFSFLMAAYGNVAVLPVFYIVKSGETKATSLKLSANAAEEIGNWNPQLKFGEDFLKCDTTPLERLVDVNKEFIKEIHTNLRSGLVKEEKFLEILKQNSLLTKDYYNMYCIRGYALHPRLGSGGNVLGEHGYKERFKLTSADPASLYPALKQESLNEIAEILYFVKKYPLEEQ